MIHIKNGKLYTMAGEVIEKGSILIEHGKIIAIGENVEAPTDAEVIDASGKLVFPGFIDAHCHLGMWEDSIGFEGADGNESVDPVTPHLRAIDAIYPMDRTFEEAREGGVTTVCTGPGSANVIGENPKRTYSNQKKSPSTRMATAAMLREQLFKARIYKEKLEKAKEDPDKKPDYDMKLEPLVKVLNKEIPLKAHAMMSRAGLKVAITTDHPVVPIQYLSMCAGLAVKDGMDEMEALNAIYNYVNS